MSFETDWDVEQYRHAWDSDDQWEVRKQFMLAHKDEIPEEKLVCLAQVYANIEFLQCSYPAKVMEQVKVLAAGLDDTVLEKRRQKQNINFVKAEKRSTSDQDLNPEKQKRGRLETPVDANRATNRPTASSYFAGSTSSEPSCDPSPATCSSKTEPQTQYSMQQSYYTSTYHNRPQNPPVSDFGRGPGANSNYPPDATLDSVSGSNFCNDNTKSDQNLKPGTTTISGKIPAKDCTMADLENRLKRLAGLISASSFKGRVLSRFKKSAKQLHLNLEIVCQKQKGKKKDKGQFFVCVVRINDIEVCSVSAERDVSQAKLSACQKALNKLKHPHLKVFANGAGVLKLRIRDCGTAKDQDQSFRSNQVAVPGPLLLAPEDLARAKSKFKTFVIFESDNAMPMRILELSSKMNGRRMRFCMCVAANIKIPAANSQRCLIEIDNMAVGEGVGDTSEEAQEAAATAALEFLRCIAFTIIRKNAVVPGRCVTKEEFEKMNVNDQDSVDPHKKAASLIDVAISEDNVGNKLLRRMGWSGGGLGRAGNQGIAEPIKATDVRGREGLGAAALPRRGRMPFTRDPFIEKAKEIMLSYAWESVDWDLVFSAGFSVDESRIIQGIAEKLGLESTVKGKEDEQCLVISQPRDRIKIVEQLIKDGGSNETYSVIPPTGKTPGSVGEPSDSVRVNHSSV